MKLLLCHRLLPFLFCFYTIQVVAQVGINTDNADPDASAMLDISSSNKGLLIPRMTSTERGDIMSPAKGLLVFDNTTNSFWYYNGSSWITINEIQDLNLTGNNLKITNNGSATIIDLSAYLDNTDTQLTESQVDGFVANNGYITNANDADADATNEIQDLNLTGNNLKITNNGSATTIDLSAYLDNTDTQLTESQVDGFVANNGYITNANDADADATNEIQDLNLTSNNLKITNNGSATTIDLSAYLDNTDTQLTESQVDGFVANNGYITNANDADADPTNEIEIPTGGTNGQILSTDGMGNLSWANDQNTLDNLGNHTATANLNLNGKYLSNDGTDNGIFLNSNNHVGVNTASPNAPLTVNGTMVIGADYSNMKTTLGGTEDLVIPGGNSDYIISTQDGNGRVQHKWNATTGTNEKYIVGGEDAAFIDLNATADNDNSAWIEFKHADGASAVAGESINWNTQLIINQGGEVGINELSPDDMLHVTSGGNGTRVRAENTSNGWAGLLSKNSIGEMFVGLQGAFDANPGEFHFFDNVAGARRMVIDATGNFGIGKNNPSVKLDVNGSVNCTGGTCSSDIRWKKDIQPLENVLTNILQMRGVSYDWRKEEFPDRDFTSDRQIGLIAQEVETIYPELVKTDEEGFKSMDYMSLTAILLEAVKNLKTENDQLKTTLKAEKSAQLQNNQQQQTEIDGLKMQLLEIMGQLNAKN